MSPAKKSENPFGFTFTPRQYNHEVRRWTPSLMLTLLTAFGAIAVIVVAGWQLGWWLTSQNAQRTARVVQQNYNVQQGYLKAITNDVSAIDANIATAGSTPNAGMIAQNIHSGNDACSYWQMLDTSEVSVQADMKKWAAVNCADGALTPTSTVYKGGNGE